MLLTHLVGHKALAAPVLHLQLRHGGVARHAQAGHARLAGALLVAADLARHGRLVVRNLAALAVAVLGDVAARHAEAGHARLARVAVRAHLQVDEALAGVVLCVEEAILLSKQKI